MDKDTAVIDLEFWTPSEQDAINMMSKIKRNSIVQLERVNRRIVTEKGRLWKANKDYMLAFAQDTKWEVLPPTTSFPELHLKLVSLQDFMTRETGNIVLLVASTTAVTSVATKKGPSSKQTVYLADPASSKRVKLDVWGDAVKQPFKVGEPLGLRDARWNAQQKVITLFNNTVSSFLTGDEIPGQLAKELVEFHNKTDTSTLALMSSEARDVPWAAFRAMKTYEYGGVYRTSTMILNIEPGNLFREGCAGCGAWPSSAETTFRCNRCFIEATRKLTYDFPMQLGTTLNTSLTFRVNNDVGKQLLGSGPQELKSSLMTSRQACKELTSRLQSYNGKAVTVECSVKMNPKTKNFVYYVTRIDTDGPTVQMNAQQQPCDNNLVRQQHSLYLIDQLNALKQQYTNLPQAYRGNCLVRFLHVLDNNREALALHAEDVLNVMQALPVPVAYVQRYVEFVLEDVDPMQRTKRIVDLANCFTESTHIPYFQSLLDTIFDAIAPSSQQTPKKDLTEITSSSQLTVSVRTADLSDTVKSTARRQLLLGDSDSTPIVESFQGEVMSSKGDHSDHQTDNRDGEKGDEPTKKRLKTTPGQSGEEETSKHMPDDSKDKNKRTDGPELATNSKKRGSQRTDAAPSAN